MYAAKAGGGHRYVSYEAQLYDATVARMELKADLRGAFERGELHVAYQPIVDLGSADITGFEALMRWNHPKHGPVAPVDFIPLAEQNGLILDLGRWILETACRQTRALQTATDRTGLSVSVNLSGRQILDPDLVSDVRRALAESGLPPSDLVLEMTESVLVQDVAATVGTLQALKALGVRLAIDDFGTGYSSLSYLRQFPIDILKIDRSFISGLDGSNDSTALVRSILDLSSTLRLETVAEGIEAGRPTRHPARSGRSARPGLSLRPPDGRRRPGRPARRPNAAGSATRGVITSARAPRAIRGGGSHVDPTRSPGPPPERHPPMTTHALEARICQH